MNPNPAGGIAEKIARTCIILGGVFAISYVISVYYLFGPFDGLGTIGDLLIVTFCLGGPSFLTGLAATVIYARLHQRWGALAGVVVTAAAPLFIAGMYIYIMNFMPTTDEFEQQWESRSASILKDPADGIDCQGVTENTVLNGNKVYFPRGWRLSSQSQPYIFHLPKKLGEFSSFQLEFFPLCGGDGISIREEKKVGMFIWIRLPDGCLYGDGVAGSEAEFDQFICSVKLTAEAAKSGQESESPEPPAAGGTVSPAPAPAPGGTPKP